MGGSVPGVAGLFFVAQTVAIAGGFAYNSAAFMRFVRRGDKNRRRRCPNCYGRGVSRVIGRRGRAGGRAVAPARDGFRSLGRTEAGPAAGQIAARPLSCGGDHAALGRLCAGPRPGRAAVFARPGAHRAAARLQRGTLHLSVPPLPRSASPRAAQPLSDAVCFVGSARPALRVRPAAGGAVVSGVKVQRSAITRCRSASHLRLIEPMQG